MKPDAPEQPPRHSRAELAAAISLFVATLVFGGLVVQHRLSPGTGGGSTVITPTVVAEGVTVTPGSGRLLLVESKPRGAVVTLDGLALGETPFSSDLNCGGARPMTLEVSLAGYKTERFQLACVNGSTRVSVSLKKR